MGRGGRAVYKEVIAENHSFFRNDSAARVSMTTDTAVTIRRSSMSGNSGPSGGVLERFPGIMPELDLVRKVHDDLVPCRRLGLSEAAPLIIMLAAPANAKGRWRGGRWWFANHIVYVRRRLTKGLHSSFA